MYLTDAVTKGEIVMKVEGKRYVIKFTPYNGYGNILHENFEGRSLKEAYQKLEERLINS